MAVSMPISVSMIFACLSYFIASHGDIGIICHKIMYNTYNSYVIIAVPLFIFMANVMNAGQVTDILFEFSKACIGKRRGALAHVNALLSLIFAGMSGSAVADASGIGTIEIAAMKKDGYDDEFSCAITAATATVGPVFPPSINLVVFAMISGASVGSLLLAGIVPALMMTGSLMLYVAYISKKRNYPAGEKVCPQSVSPDDNESVPRAPYNHHPARLPVYRHMHGYRGRSYCVALLYRHIHVSLPHNGSQKALGCHKAKCHPVRQHNSSYLCCTMLLIYNCPFRPEPAGRRFSAVCYQQQITYS